MKEFQVPNPRDGTILLANESSRIPQINHSTFTASNSTCMGMGVI